MQQVKPFFQRFKVPIVLALSLLAGLFIGLSAGDGDGCATDECKLLCHALGATYTVDGQPIALKGGRQLQPSPSGQPVVTTQIVRLPVRGTLEGAPGLVSAIVLDRQTPEQSGLYVAVAYLKDGDVSGSNALPLADQAAIDDISFQDGMLWVTYRPDASQQQLLRQYAWKDGGLQQVG